MREQNVVVTILCGSNLPRSYDLEEHQKENVTFGRSEENDIVIPESIISGHHGAFIKGENGWEITDCQSTNGIYFEEKRITSKQMKVGDVYKIDDIVQPLAEGVSIVVEHLCEEQRWERFALEHRQEVTIGRSSACDIQLNYVSVSKQHARIQFEHGTFFLYDMDSTNGISVNGQVVKKKVKLQERDLILITTVKLIFTSQAILYTTLEEGIRVDAIDIVKTVKTKQGKMDIVNHINLCIEPGEFVAIIGGSGAGKTTFMNCLSGYNRATSGQVLINGENLYENYEVVKNVIGYVPQQDIVYDNLTLQSMLEYAAKLRMPKDTSKEERRKRIQEVVQAMELTGKEHARIGSLSGGQKKRASIAVELLSDPNLFFLDEPTSGLDPGTERNLMKLLQSMAKERKTIVLVTHNTLNLQLCDKIIFLGKGGNLCFCGTPKETLEFFQVEDYVDIYNQITEQTEGWKKKYAASEYCLNPQEKKKESNHRNSVHTSMSIPRQMNVLSARYRTLLLNDAQRMLLLLLQAPLLAVLIYLVADGTQFEEYESTKAILFSLSCCAFWIGILNSIQEICKERVILKREYMTGEHILSYLGSKIFILGLFGMIQAGLLLGVFALLVGLPAYESVGMAFFKLYLTTWLTMVSATGMGLFVSSLFKNADRAMTVAPLLLMPQILFSGVIFKLSGATEKISVFVNSRWTMEGYGTICNLNELSLRINQEIPEYLHEKESFFVYTDIHLYNAWMILFIFTLVFGGLCYFALYKSLKN